MKTKRLGAMVTVLAAAFLAGLACPAWGDVIAGVTVEDFSSENTGFGSDRIAAASIDSHATFDSVAGTLEACDRGWVTDPAGTDHTPYCAYDLGAAHNLSGVRIWNWNQEGGGGIGFVGSGINTATISVAGTDKVYTDVADIIVPIAPAADGYTGVLFGVTAANVQYVKISPHSNYWSDTLNETGGDAWENQVCMGKIQFEGMAVPEPSACLLLVTALTGLLAYAWKKRR